MYWPDLTGEQQVKKEGSGAFLGFIWGFVLGLTKPWVDDEMTRTGKLNGCGR